MSTLKTKLILLKELLALKEVVDKGSIQIAAGENGIKNSNLSQLIKDLEDRFDTKLINRGFDGSQPTNSTQIIYNDICAIEELLNKISENFAWECNISCFAHTIGVETLKNTYSMSLDLYIRSKTPVRKRGTGVYIRENGKTRELKTVAEVREYFPDADLSDIKMQEYETNDLRSMRFMRVGKNNKTGE